MACKGYLRCPCPRPSPSPSPSVNSSTCRFATFKLRSRRLRFLVRNDAEIKEVSPTATATDRSDADKLVDKISFGELCNEFKCISSPSVEATARQLARDILEMRDTNKAIQVFAASVKYKDPLRSFTGRDKYKRSSWITSTLDQPVVAVQEMSMLSTSILNIKWIVRGRPKLTSLIFGDLTIIIYSTYTLNQISGQVLEHVEEWNVSDSSSLGQAYFWVSRLLYSTAESGNDLFDAVNNAKSWFAKEEERSDIFADPPVDPTKFFQMDNSSQRDVYQVGLFLAFIYLVVQFLRSTL